ncbi:hypothetical protein R4P70_32505 [Rhodococcus sp. IEGM 1241]|uniref:hypothetical protein n=1 Tax=Rhodococcus sp. IEGM 1241 TaxID=3082228 RepID=UPI002954BEEB|nr:hypothetical protein [Rhodococcus sp. IEGM 1241]MDV8016031.1 hypothetical protein [Rhodococcus sp. IEGM 1241]
MNRAQLDLCLQGADLLKGHMRGLDRSLDSAIKRQDRAAVEAALDPLVHVAGVLIRKLAIVSGTSGSAAFTDVVARCDPEYANEYDILESLLSIVITGGVPDRITCNTALLAIAAQEVGANAIGLIAETTHEHPFKVVGGLAKLLNAQDPSVQVTDNASASAALTVYALDPAMAASRKGTADLVVRLTGRVADNSYSVAQSLHEGGETDAGLAYSGLARVAMTATSLSAGVLGMIADSNHYSWSALLRQVAECEYLLWKFSAESASVMDWLGSGREEREARWPSRLYSDDDNDYRRKDYSLHCEFGGHPTPDGTLAAGQILTPEQDATQAANGYTHLLQHLHSIFEFAVACADDLDTLHKRLPTVPEDVRNEYAEAVALHLKTDKFGPATAHFSDPLP